MWFKKHLNWVIYFSWILSGIIWYISSIIINDENSQIWYFIGAICVLVSWGALVWTVWVKRRSWYNLFYLLIPIFGYLIIWGLSSKVKLNEPIEKRGVISDETYYQTRNKNN
jgi:hypothetical protein